MKEFQKDLTKSSPNVSLPKWWPYLQIICLFNVFYK